MKLMPEDFHFIRSQVAAGKSQYSLAKQFEVSKQRINQIVKGMIGKKHLQQSTQNSTQTHPEEK